MRMDLRAAVMGVLGVAVLSYAVQGQDRARYREFALKSDLAAVSALTGATSSATRLIHARPAVLQDLEWRPSRWGAALPATETDPVERIMFSFYNDQLYRMAVDYRHDRTQGLIDSDLTQAISAVYGTPTVSALEAPRLAAPGVEADWGARVAQWGDDGHRVVLYRRSSYRETFQLVVSDPELEVLAQEAAIQAVLLDRQEAPARELARRQKTEDDERAAAEQARIANRAAFQP